MLSKLKQQSKTYFSNSKIELKQKKISPRMYLIYLIMEYLQSNPGNIHLYLQQKISDGGTVTAKKMMEGIRLVSVAAKNQHNFYFKLKQLVLQMMAKNLFKKEDVMLYLPYDLQPNPVTFVKQTHRVATRNQFEVKKANLLQEQSNGYAQFAMIMTKYPYRTTKNIHQLWGQVTEMVGKFDLDYGKILDLLIEQLSTNKWQYFKELIKTKFTIEMIVKIVSSKMYNCKNQEQYDCTQKYYENYEYYIKTPLLVLYKQSLYPYHPKYLTLLTKLIQHEIVTLKDLQPHLPYCKTSELHKIILKKYELSNTKILYHRSAMMMDDTSQEEIQKKKMQDKIIVYGMVISCVKMGVLVGIIQMGDFERFQRVVEEQYGFQVDWMVFAPIVGAFSRKVQQLIEPLYQQCFLKNFFRKGKFSTLKPELSLSFFTTLNRYLRYLSSNIAQNPQTFTKLIRVFKMMLKKPEKLQLKQNQSQIKSEIGKIIKKYLLPSFPILKCNIPIANEFYELLEMYNYLERFQFYVAVFDEYYDSPLLCYLGGEMESTLTATLNKLSSQNQIDTQTKIIKYLVNYPMQTSLFIVERIVNPTYDIDLPMFLECYRNAMPMAQEMMVCLIMSKLNQWWPHLLTQQLEVTHRYKVLMELLFKLYRYNRNLNFEIVIKYIQNKLNQTKSLPIKTITLKLLTKFITSSFSDYLNYDYKSQRQQFLTVGAALKIQIKENNKIFYNLFNLRKKIIEEIIGGDQYQDVDQDQVKLEIFGVKNAKKFVNFVGFLYQECNDKKNLPGKQNFQKVMIEMKMQDQWNITIWELVHLYTYHMRITKKNKYLRMPEQYLKSLILNHQFELNFIFFLIRNLLYPKILNTDEYQSLRQFLTLLFSLYIPQKYEKSLKTHRKSYPELNCLPTYSIKQIIDFNCCEIFYGFWLHSLEHLIYDEKRYQEIMQKLRNQIEKKNNKRRVSFGREAAEDTLDQTQKRTMKGYKHLEEEKDRLKSDYMLFQNIQYQICFKIAENYELTPKSKSKIKLQPQILEVKPQRKFTSLFLTQCLLPRLTMQQADALYCSRFIFKIIRYNKIPSNKYFEMIFTIIDAVLEYLPFASHREASKCLPIFIGDLLKLFSDWNCQQKLFKKLNDELQIQKLSEKRYKILRDYILAQISKITKSLLTINKTEYQLRNVMYFIQKTQQIPLHSKQANQIKEHFKSLLGFQYSKSLRTMIQGIPFIVESRKKYVPIYEEDQNVSEDKIDYFQKIGESFLSKSIDSQGQRIGESFLSKSIDSRVQENIDQFIRKDDFSKSFGSLNSSIQLLSKREKLSKREEEQNKKETITNKQQIKQIIIIDIDD